MLHQFLPNRTVHALFTGLFAAVLWAGFGTPVRAEDKLTVPPVFRQPEPKSFEDLQTMQDHLAKVAEKVKPCVVSIQIGPAFGSGVIVSKDGYVLTAGHVSGKADQECTLIFHDGKKVKAKTLGANHGIDSGMIQITEKGDWPFAEMAKSGSVSRNQWVFVSAHPGGYKKDRPPVVRLGRVLRVTPTVLVTNCTMVGGDSGGPLFDMQGRVIGINSRIGGTLSSNMHVPISTFHDTWHRLAQADVWGGTPGKPAQGGAQGGTSRPNAGAAFLGVGMGGDDDCVIGQVQPGSPADKAGLQVDDKIISVNGKKVAGPSDLSSIIRAKKPGDTLNIEIKRGDETLKKKVVLGKYAGDGSGGGGGAKPAGDKPFLGVGVDPEGDGCVIGQIAPDSPAEIAGLKVGDVILTANGQKLAAANDLAEFMQTKTPGDILKLEVKRGDETIKVKLIVGKK